MAQSKREAYHTLWTTTLI